jgi:pilus assembly protein CpaF
MSRMSNGSTSYLANSAAAEEDRLLRIKTDLHTKLISELDLSAMGSMSEDELRDEVRRGAEQLWR